VEVHITSDLPDEQQGKVRWRVTNLEGQTVRDGALDVAVPPYQNAHVATLELADSIAQSVGRNALVWLELWVNGERVSDNLVLFARPKYLSLLPPEIQSSVRQTGERRFEVDLTASHPALWVWLSTPDGEFTYSDNFFHLLPGQSRVVEIFCEQDVTASELKQRLRVQSLVDTYAERPLPLKSVTG
jgi:beta-mannosidase